MPQFYNIAERIGKVINKYPICVESGCTYVTNELNLVNTTTNNIIEYIVKPKDGVLYSFDISLEHIHICKEMLIRKFGKFTPYVDFILGDSISTMPQLISDLGGYKIDLICLDSKEHDSKHMTKEFNILFPLLADSHFILIDDVLNKNSVKAIDLLPYLDFYIANVDTSYKKYIIGTETGLAVYVKGYDVKL